MLNELQDLIAHLPLDGWTVLLCPTPAKKNEAARLLSAILPASAKFSGRTAVLKDGRQISIVEVSEPQFIPAGTNFVIGMLGWTSKDETTGVATWRQKSSGSIQTQ